ncbi:hypothetical protein HDV04_001263 [Boothiomyces sp. JEL0838]|nr:hypothetical protein HDV04_001263 [Boothiomyces sp. JEL0838]
MSTTQPYSLIYNPNPSFLNTYQSQSLVLTTNYINPIDNYKRSTWDLVWSNWPNFAGQGLGDWEYYCPDAGCKNAFSSDGWNSITGLADPTVIPQSWIAMGAIRWNPKTTPVGNSETIRTINGQLYGFTANQTLEVQVLASSGSSSNTAVNPYASAASCGSYGYALGANGASTLQNPYGFGSFNAYSPIRPLCGSGSASANTPFNIGDFTITPSDSSTVLLNGWISVQSSIKLPTGFSVLNFTGTVSNIGTIDSAVYVNLGNQITLVTPEVRFYYASQIASKANVGALVYDTGSGSSWFLGAADWNFNPNIPNRIKITASSSGLLIFGVLDNTVNAILPGQFSALLYYIGLWSSKTYSFGSLTVSFQSTLDISFMVSPISVLSTGSSPIVSYNIGFAQSLEYDGATGFPQGPLTGSLAEPDPFYLGSYDYYNNKEDMQHNLALSLETSFDGGQVGLGLSYPKLRSEMHYGLGMFQPMMIPTPTDAYASAPAAFGVYQHSSHSTPHVEEYNPAVPLDVTSDNYDYYYQYQLDNHNNEWLDQRNPYELDQFSEFVQDEVGPFDYSRIDHSIHVNPAILEGNLGVESEQTIAIESPLEKKRKGGRSAGQPTNIVPNTKMDRKTLKRLRNRVSASRCRIKKKEWIHEMEDQSLQLQDENMFLMERISFLEESIANSRKFLEYYQLQKADSSLNLQ